jgi:DNA (cytosine-5)-methyltransferase 1
MAGFRVAWANEFVPAAQASYKANASEHCTLDGRDIKLVLAEDIYKATGLKQGELDLFDGSPPCQAFSTAGKREKGWGKKKGYEHGASQCNEQLFTQYIRLVRDLQPRTFVAENVSGLVKGTAKGYFLEILADLKACGYAVKCKVLDAQWLGVPQQRQRTIFVGVRNDIDLPPAHPKPLPYRYSVRDALPHIGSSVEDPGGQFAVRKFSTGPHGAITCSNAHHIKVTELPPSRRIGSYGVTEVAPDKPCATVTTASPGNDLAVPHNGQRRKFTIAELKRICAFPDDFILKGSYAQQWERLGNSVPPVMMRHIAETIRDEILLPSAPASSAQPSDTAAHPHE